MAAKKLERDVRAEVLAYLQSVGVFVKVHTIDNRRLSTGLGVGTPDLIGILPGGRFLGIELKRPGLASRTTAEQDAWIGMINRMGGLGFVATSAEEVKSKLEEASCVPS